MDDRVKGFVDFFHHRWVVVRVGLGGGESFEEEVVVQGLRGGVEDGGLTGVVCGLLDEGLELIILVL